MTVHINDKRIQEASGHVVSKRNPGIILVISDEDTNPLVFQVEISTGRVVGWFGINIKTIDTESLAIDVFGNVWIADTGDNKGTRKNIRLIYLPEPPVGKFGRLPAKSLKLKYPNKKHYNCETLIINPVTNVKQLVTKGDTSYVFQYVGTKKLALVKPIFHMKQFTDGTWNKNGTYCFFRHKDWQHTSVYDQSFNYKTHIWSPPLAKGESISRLATELILGSEGKNSPLVTVPIPLEFQ